MEKQKFNITINASRERVWDVLWGSETYPAWTAPFAEGSNAQTDWQKGSRVLFTDGSGSGMISEIAEKVPNEYMSFRHLGMLIDGVEDLESEKVKKWAGAYENYTLKTAGNGTEVIVDIDIDEEHKDYFTESWPKALNKLKEIAE